MSDADKVAARFAETDEEREREEERRDNEHAALTYDEREWNLVAEPRPGEFLDRIKVPGGWLYRTTINWLEGTTASVAMCFVPDPPSDPFGGARVVSWRPVTMVEEPQ